MCATGVSFAVLSNVLKLGFSVVTEDKNFHLSTSHLFKRYQKLAESKELVYCNEIRNETSFGTICFDHHSMKQLGAKFLAKEHRLVVLWHSNFEDKLLSVEKMGDKTERSQLQAILTACETFNIGNHQIVAVTCDNENTNTGNDMGTCVLLEEEWLIDLLRLMCRHHIYEIVLKLVYKFLFSFGAQQPINLFYTILIDVWPQLKDQHFPFIGFDANDEEEMGFDPDQLFVYESLKEIAIADLQNHSNHRFIRDDYEEITNVSLKFLTGLRKNLIKSNQVQFNTLQNPSNARFMASAIQGLNCFLFRNQLDWDSQERERIKENLSRFCLFLTLIYVRYWNRSSILFDAGINDLNFLKDLEQYAILDGSVSQVAIDGLSRHLYYLSEELIVLCLFSDKISSSEKNHIAARLLQIPHQLPNRNLRLNHVKFNEYDDIDDWGIMQLVDFVGDRSLHLFQILDIPMHFLSINASQWTVNAEYLSAKDKIEAALVCVNDATERVISTCKSKYKKQRFKNDVSFRRSMYENYINK